jgi:hypothetical protein
MALPTAGGLASGMALGGHIRRKNYEFTSIKGPAPTTTHGYDPNLCHRDPGHVAHSGHTLRTAFSGSILEFTYLEGLVSSLTAGRGQASRSGNQRSMARNKLAQGMASTSHILLGNHAVNRTERPTPVSILSCDPDLHPIGLDPAVHTGRTLETALGGCIPECTHVRGPVPFLIPGHGRDFHPGNQMAMAHGDLTQGMAHGGHILFGTARSPEAMGQRPSSAHTLTRPVAWHNWTVQQNHAPGNVITSEMQ